jgi:hypothetical protein
MLIDQYFPYPTTEQAFFESLFPKKGADNFHRQWAADFSAARKNFYDVADQSKGGLNPVKETWKEAYKTFYAYLAKTFDFVTRSYADRLNAAPRALQALSDLQQRVRTGTGGHC